MLRIKSLNLQVYYLKQVDKKTLKQLYYSFVYPYLIYGIEIWGNASNIHLDPIIKLQKRCVRIITFSNYLESTSPL